MKRALITKYGILTAFAILCILCTPNPKQKNVRSDSQFSGKEGEVKLIVLDPGHFHASLLLKDTIRQVNDTVFVYAPHGEELEQFLQTIKTYNSRKNSPTAWVLNVYDEADYLEKMISDKKGNVVILAGNNKNKTEYIYRSIASKLNVLSDKPMAINRQGFELLEKTYQKADSNDVYLYDMMTERYDILNIIEKELIQNKELFGELQQGTPDNPAISMESVHHFYKEVSGVPTIRPAWYYDIEQQGEGIADVTTHLIDLVNWKCFPEEAIDYKHDINLLSATHWPTKISLDEFTKSTRLEKFPNFLIKYVKDSLLHVYANGTIHYQVKGMNTAIKVQWDFQAPEGGGDTFGSVIKGTKAVLKTRQDKQQNYVKQLYIQKTDEVSNKEFEKNLQKTIEKIRLTYPFVSLSQPLPDGSVLINIPLEKREGHEEHFKYVAKQFFEYLVNRNMPDWEISNTLAKYYITTKAVEIAKEEN